MLFERQLSAGVVLCGNILLVRSEADLGVHHHLLVAGQLNQHIRLEAFTIGALKADLGLILAAFLQAGVFQHAFQHQFAPVTLSFLALERSGQVGRLIAQTLVELLQTLQLLTQGKAFTGFLLIAFFHTFFEGLDALLERIKQLAELLLAGLGKTLLALIKDLPGQFSKLRTQLIARALQVAQALLMAVLLFFKFGAKGRTLGIQTADFSFLLFALIAPSLSGFAGDLPLLLEQVGFTTQRRQFSLLIGLDLADLGDFLAAIIQLRRQAGLGQLRIFQTLL